ncbi:class I SAM-dependent methyltransferase [Mucilaginibacter sp. UYCu711]|uniref:class I SAM-dependent methyltransferase n=1 Tax=Mucilaginibacter sp. UYCu711 TaxID=3156339 RepID=UPI003D221AA2
MACLFCGSDKVVNSPYESTLFNNKEFSYLKCASCDLVYISPFPNNDDFEKMYPITYQGAFATAATGRYDWLFKDIEKSGKYSKVLDYGCGEGKFLLEAMAKGYEVTGVEFNLDLVKSLKAAFPQNDFLSTTQFFESDERFDIIFLGNVLEHLTNPREMIQIFKSKLLPEGLLVMEGPLEDNFTLAGAIRKAFFSVRKKSGKKVSHTPWHMFFSNYNNQLAVINDAGFETIKYQVKEHPWPFPVKLAECNSIKSFTFFSIAKLSMLVDKCIYKSGNNFTYIGKSAGNSNNF